MTMQQNENIVENIAWYSVAKDNTKGPITALTALESVTSSWSNVETIEYTMGKTAFGKDNNAYTGCIQNGESWNCDKNTYTLGAKSSKVRMITVQEAVAVGCKFKENTCPGWIKTGGFYWTMSAISSNSNDAWSVYNSYSDLYGGNTIATNRGARAVVVISK